MAAEIDIRQPLRAINTRRFNDTPSDVESVEVYPSIEDVPLPRVDIAPVNFEGLPRYNFVKLLVEANRKMTDAYPEYSIQTGFAALSAVIRRRAYFLTNGTETYLNIWALLLGPSSSRKTPPMDIGSKLIQKSIGNAFLPYQCTPETLLKQMANRYEIKTKGGKSEIIERYEPGEIPPGQRIFWKDEAGGFYSQVGKTHMKGILDTFDDLYKCPNVVPPYTLANETYHLENIFFPMMLATTPKDFCKSMSSADSRTGHLPRMLIVMPTYINPDWKGGRGPIRENSLMDIRRMDALIHALNIIDTLLNMKHIRLTFEDGILRNGDDEYGGLANLWSGEREGYFKEHKHDLEAFMGKYQTSALKIAALIDIGNLPYVIAELGDDLVNCDRIELTFKPDEIPSDDVICEKILSVDLEKLKAIRLQEITITKESFIYAARLFDTVYIPYANALISELGECSSVQPSIIDRLYNVLQGKGVATRSELISKVRAGDRKTFDDAISIMLEAGRIKRVIITGKTKPTEAYVYIPPDNDLFTHLPYSGISMPIKDFHVSVTVGENVVDHRLRFN